jgi:hypothetical protein
VGGKALGHTRNGHAFRQEREDFRSDVHVARGMSAAEMSFYSGSRRLQD